VRRSICLVHISTDYVFDGTNPAGYREHDPVAPVNAYGRSKAKGEAELLANAHNYYLVRTSWLYGHNSSPVRGSKPNFVSRILDLARTKPELRIVNDQHGKPTFADDLALFVKDLVLGKVASGVYHGVNEYETTWYHFAEEILRLARLTTKLAACS